MSYEFLAPYYDQLMEHAPYERFVCDWRSCLTHRPSLVLDLGCGTGRLSYALASQGLSVIGVDQSEAMLALAYGRCAQLHPAPLFLQQDMSELDLYGTVDSVVSSMDSINYITQAKQWRQVFKRVKLFLEPGGSFFFDLKMPPLVRETAFITQAEGVYCVTESRYTPSARRLHHEITLFVQEDRTWRRMEETHEQRLFFPEEVKDMLLQTGFQKVRLTGPFVKRGPKPQDSRFFVWAVR